MHKLGFSFLLVVLAASACGGTTGDVISSNDGGGSTPLFPPGPVDCINGPNYTGCACQSGAVKPCYTGPAATLGVGGCKPGTQTCEAQSGDNAGPDYGPCQGEVVPTEANPCTSAPSSDGGAGDDGGTPCNANTECPVNEGPEGPIGARGVCAYPVDGGCSAMGRCVLPSGSAGCAASTNPPLVCTCAGVTTGLPGLGCGIGTPGYVTTPIVSPTSGVCNSDGGAPAPCMTASDCPPAQPSDVCGFAIAQACQATGICLPHPPVSNCVTSPLTACGCDGVTVSWWDQCAATEPPGYAPVPIAGTGSCGDGG